MMPVRPFWMLVEHTPIQTDELSPDEVVAYYGNYFRMGRDAILPDLDYIKVIQYEANKVWYELGLYTKYNRDYFGKTYILVEGGTNNYHLREIMQEQEHIQDVFGNQ